MEQRFNKNFQAVMTARTIEDLSLKMQSVKKVPIDRVVAMFFDMCNWGIEMYIQEEKKRFPGKTDAEIMHEYHARRNNNR